MVEITKYVELKKKELRELLKDKEKSLAIIHVGNDYASERYIIGKVKDSKEVGITANVYSYPEEITEEELIIHIKNIKEDGLIVQLPIPKHINVSNIISAIPKQKDVDGFVNNSDFIPCTPKGIMDYLNYNNVNFEGKNVVIIGRSDIVGKPMSKLALNSNATVTICHSHTKNIKKYCEIADIIIIAIGKAKFLNSTFLDTTRKDYCIIDVGINRDNTGKLCGDVDFEDVKDLCNIITPVPKGVGLLTRLALIENVSKTK